MGKHLNGLMVCERPVFAEMFRACLHLQISSHRRKHNSNQNESRFSHASTKVVLEVRDIDLDSTEHVFVYNAGSLHCGILWIEDMIS